MIKTIQTDDVRGEPWVVRDMEYFGNATLVQSAGFDEILISARSLLRGSQPVLDFNAPFDRSTASAINTALLLRYPDQSKYDVLVGSWQANVNIDLLGGFSHRDRGSSSEWTFVPGRLQKALESGKTMVIINTDLLPQPVKQVLHDVISALRGGSTEVSLGQGEEYSTSIHPDARLFLHKDLY